MKQRRKKDCTEFRDFHHRRQPGTAAKSQPAAGIRDCLPHLGSAIRSRPSGPHPGPAARCGLFRPRPTEPLHRARSLPCLRFPGPTSNCGLTSTMICRPRRSDGDSGKPAAITAGSTKVAEINETSIAISSTVAADRTPASNSGRWFSPAKLPAGPGEV